MSDIQRKKGDSDFHMLFLTRFLYLAGSRSNNENIDSLKRKIVNTMLEFPFWPIDSCSANRDFDDIVFWSENHLFMTLSSCYLLRQYISEHASPESYTRQSESDGENPLEFDLWELDMRLDLDFEGRLLQTYLAAHCHPLFNGFYEAGSAVYLPFTMAALLNIYDFAPPRHRPLRVMASRLLHLLASHIATITTSRLGSCNIAGQVLAR